MLGQSGKAAAFLLAAGFCAGFCLTKGSAHLFAPQLASGGSPGTRPDGAPAIPPSGSQDESGLRTTSLEGGEPLEHAPALVATAALVQAAPATRPAPEQAAPDLLTGNTLTVVKGGTTITRYLAPAGWQAVETRPGLLTVKHWILRPGQLCEVTAIVACEPVAVVPDKAATISDGAVLGTATLAGLHWIVHRGKPARFPDAVPLIDDGRPAAPELAGKATLAGQKALQRFVGRTLLVADGSKGDRYEPDGRWITALPLQPGEARGRGGVQVTIGRWLFTAGKLCLDGPGLELSRLCYRAEQWGPDTLRLIADRTGTVITLTATAAR